MSSSPKSGAAEAVDKTLLEGARSPADEGHPAFATTAIGPADVRDTPLQPPVIAAEDEDDAPDPFVGRTLGGLYRIEKRLGRGGMGTVYAAEHVHLQKQFAVKVLAPEIARHQGAVERLRQEAVAASRIEHENIVAVSNFARSEEGDVFIVMELLRGSDLAGLVAQGPLPLQRAIPIAMQIARALGAAHGAGIVHRDLKPENVFIVPKGGIDFVKVLDFGISKVKSADAESVRMTKTGQLVGTPLYMSPEQARGEPDIDKRCDVYALGVILYEMITGSPPFYGDNYFQLLWKHGNEPPQPMKERNPNVFVPPALEAVVQKALAKKRDERYASMEALEAALTAAVPEYAELVAARASLPLRSPPPAAERPSGADTSGPRAASSASGVSARPASRLPLLVGGGVLAVAAAAVALAVAAGSGDDRDSTRSAAGRGDPGSSEDTSISGHAAVPGSAQSPGNEDATTPAGGNPGSGGAVSGESGAIPNVGGARTTGVVRFTSQPPGAGVWLGDGRLCETPCERDLALGTSVEVRFALPGHLDERKTFLVADGLQVAASLARRPRGGASGGSGNAGGGSPGGGLGIKQSF
jgi:serine/threonine-protein kinase